MTRRYRHRSNGRSRKLFLRQIWRTQRTAIARRPPHGHRGPLPGTARSPGTGTPDRIIRRARSRLPGPQSMERMRKICAGPRSHARRRAACRDGQERRPARGRPATRYLDPQDRRVRPRRPGDAEVPSTAAAREQEVAGPGGRVPCQVKHPPVRGTVRAAAWRTATFRATCIPVRPCLAGPGIPRAGCVLLLAEPRMAGLAGVLAQGLERTGRCPAVARDRHVSERIGQLDKPLQFGLEFQ